MKMRILLLLPFVLLFGCESETAKTPDKPVEKPKKIEVKMIDVDPNLLETATARALEELPDFETLYAAHPKKSFVRFSHTFKGGKTEDVWAQITNRSDKALDVNIVTMPDGVDASQAKAKTTIDKISDWQVEAQEGEYRGGYTAQAMILLKQSEGTGKIKETDINVPGFVDPLITLK